jgi:hypothetical protein
MKKTKPRSYFYREAVGNMIFAYAPIVMGLVMLIFGNTAMRNPSRFGYISLFLFILGFVLFVIAKVINFKKGVLISFGSGSMSSRQRLTYRVGYVCMGVGFLGAVSSVLAFHAIGL